MIVEVYECERQVFEYYDQGQMWGRGSELNWMALMV